MAENVTLAVNGRSVEVPAGSMVSTAVAAAGLTWCRRSVTGEVRAPVCGMGVCFECRVTIDGSAHAKSCQIRCGDGMKVETDAVSQDWKNLRPDPRPVPARARHDYDVVVIGAGPAGLSSAWTAAEGGASVAIIDDNESGGGQIWRGDARATRSREEHAWLHRIAAANVEFLTGTRVFDLPSPGTIFAETTTGTLEIGYRSLIIAAGARERFLPFPGWTLPNVCGAGGLQALVKSGLPIKGKRVVVAGTGPLLLAVADYLKKRGARVQLVAEQVPMSRLSRFGLALLSSMSKVTQALGLLKRLAGTPMRFGCWVTEARGEERLERVTFSDGKKTTIVECDYLALGFHLVPNVEVAALSGCHLNHGAVVVDELQRTSVGDIYSAGESTGIGGLELALIEGQIAGYAATGLIDRARKLFGTRARLRKFSDLLDRTFALREELKALATSETIICRCEDVKWNQLLEHSSWRGAKLHTRCGMGPCQGRICGPAVSFLLDWDVTSVRPPIFPARMDSLTAIGN
ncbi:MAG: FAD-dependent oxidoreductase [Acidobacteriota bacterium]